MEVTKQKQRPVEGQWQILPSHKAVSGTPHNGPAKSQWQTLPSHKDVSSTPRHGCELYR